MGLILKTLSAVLWPPKGGAETPSEYREAWWKTVCFAFIVPVAAVIHNTLVFPRNCMLNPFGPDYTLDVTMAWLRGDPSLPWAVVIGLIIYRSGKSRRWIRLLTAPVFVAFLPLSVWVWDIPFTHRIVCALFHDGRLIASGGLRLRSLYFYIEGGIVYVAMLARFLVPMRDVTNTSAPPVQISPSSQSQRP